MLSTLNRHIIPCRDKHSFSGTFLFPGDLLELTYPIRMWKRGRYQHQNKYFPTNTPYFNIPNKWPQLRLFFLKNVLLIFIKF